MQKQAETTDETSVSYLLSRWLKSTTPLFIVSILIGLLVLLVFWNLIVISIQPGEAGVLYRRFEGTQIDKIYEEGLHFFSPLDKVYIYEVRKRIAFHEFDVITNKGLKVHISLAIRYRPEYDLLGILHQKIGPDYLPRVVLPQIESVMRKQLGNYTAEQIYTNEAGLLTNAILIALDEVGRNYVEVEDIIIRSITLPIKIKMAIENKLEQEEFMKSYEFRLQTAFQEAERLRIAAKGIHDYHSIIDPSLTESILRHRGIDATKELATSNNAKVVVIGSGKDGLPLILNTADNVLPDKTSEQKQAAKKMRDDKSKVAPALAPAPTPLSTPTPMPTLNNYKTPAPYSGAQNQ